MIPSGAASPAEGWKGILGRAAATTIRVSPWWWVLAMLPLVFEGPRDLRTVGEMTLAALLSLPLVFLLVIAVQLFPRSWSR